MSAQRSQAVATASPMAKATPEKVSVFAKHKKEIYKNWYEGEMVVSTLTGSIPADERVAEAWVKKRLGTENEELIREKVAEWLSEQAVEGEEKLNLDEAVDKTIQKSHLVKFRSDDNGLFMRDYQIKAMIKEDANIRWPKRRDWGESRKGTLSFFAEHVFVVSPEQRPECYIKKNGEIIKEADYINQQFVHTYRGHGISYQEQVFDAEIPFEVFTDHDISDKDWADIWVTAEENGLGAARSQGSGKFVLTKWDKVS